MKEKGLKVLNIVLTVIISVLILILIIGTVIGLKNRKPEEYQETVMENPDNTTPASNISSFNSDKEDFFEGMGQIRCVTKKSLSKQAIIIVKPVLSYAKGDSTFLEELSQKQKLEKKIIIDYFSNYTEDELKSNGEEAVKSDLLNLLNQEFVLGKITNLYLKDYLFIEK